MAELLVAALGSMVNVRSVMWDVRQGDHTWARDALYGRRHLPAQAEVAGVDIDLAPPRPPFAARSANRDSVNSNLSTEAPDAIRRGHAGLEFEHARAHGGPCWKVLPVRMYHMINYYLVFVLVALAAQPLGSSLQQPHVATPRRAGIAEALATPPLPPHSQRTGPDVASPPAPHGILRPNSSASDSPPGDEDGAEDCPGTPPADSTWQHKPKLVQRLKEKMHVGHASA
ncbi:hypothetical protein FB451DRAFT_1179938 [Mycena latifolia]|nr:hypothetical protein FB451DRAFT_1179938 [Mycena latifolia]